MRPLIRPAGLALLNRLVAEGVELGQLVDQIVAYLRAVLFARVAQTPELLDLPQDVIQMVVHQAELLSTPKLLSAMREFTDARSALRDQVPGVPQLPIELAFLRSAVMDGALLAAPVPNSAASATHARTNYHRRPCITDQRAIRLLCSYIIGSTSTGGNNRTASGRAARITYSNAKPRSTKIAPGAMG